MRFPVTTGRRGATLAWRRTSHGAATGVPSLLRARLLASELDARTGDVRAAARALAGDAERIGMRAVASAARDLAG